MQLTITTNVLTKVEHMWLKFKQSFLPYDTYFTRFRSGFTKRCLMRRRMIFKFGLTVIVLVAVFMFYIIHQQADQNEQERGATEGNQIIQNQSLKPKELTKEEKLRLVEKEK